ncbi:hypothetical protein AN478_04120 [Thiohalorhabdus denitrificans]|nr:hypothetical protein AN478_04120 [Thiohalorhabdus denitrificans]
MKVLYFAAVREQLGRQEEQIPAEGLQTVGDLLDRLREQGAAHAEALAPERRVLVAVNQEYADANRPLADGDEVALFPPVTGG